MSRAIWTKSKKPMGFDGFRYAPSRRAADRVTSSARRAFIGPALLAVHQPTKGATFHDGRDHAWDIRVRDEAATMLFEHVDQAGFPALRQGQHADHHRPVVAGQSNPGD